MKTIFIKPKGTIEWNGQVISEKIDFVVYEGKQPFVPDCDMICEVEND